MATAETRLRPDRSLLVRVLGFTATLIHGDSMVLDRWRWLKRRLPQTANNESLLDVGCGTGAFTIGAARRGYAATGISWDERNQRVASDRAKLCNAETADFVVGDARRLDSVDELHNEYDVVICLECIEHVLNDRKLFMDLTDRIRPGGRLLLTTPNYFYKAMSRGDLGPFAKEETGAHVRRGYTRGMLLELCACSGLECEEMSYCGGFLSQKITQLWRWLGTRTKSNVLAWIVVLPLRPLPIMFADDRLTRLLNLPFQTICLEAYKPRFATTTN